MAAKDRATLLTDLSTSFPDNSSGIITPAILRSQQTDIIDSFNGTVIQNVSTTYIVGILDDTIIATGTFTVTLPPLSTAIKPVTVKSTIGGGTITLDGDGAETIDGALTQAITAGTSIDATPSSTEWVIT